MIITNKKIVLTDTEFTELAESMWLASQYEEMRINPFARTNPEYAQEKYRRIASRALGFFNNLIPEAEILYDTDKNTA